MVFNMNKFTLEKLLREAFEMGQDWGSNMYSEFSSHWKLADQIEEEFEEFVKNTLGSYE
jgi:hypothetical protein